MLEWIQEHQAWFWSASVAMFVAGLVFVPIVVVRMPHDYFAHTEPRPSSWRGRHPALRLAVHIAKNLLGTVLLVAGIAMLVLPGQGVLTILVALSLLEFPGKRRIELAIVRRGPIQRGLNWIRAKAGRPPLELPDSDP